MTAAMTEMLFLDGVAVSTHVPCQVFRTRCRDMAAVDAFEKVQRKKNRHFRPFWVLDRAHGLLYFSGHATECAEDIERYMATRRAAVVPFEGPHTITLSPLISRLLQQPFMHHIYGTCALLLLRPSTAFMYCLHRLRVDRMLLVVLSKMDASHQPVSCTFHVVGPTTATEAFYVGQDPFAVGRLLERVLTPEQLDAEVQLGTGTLASGAVRVRGVRPTWREETLPIDPRTVDCFAEAWTARPLEFASGAATSPALRDALLDDFLRADPGTYPVYDFDAEFLARVQVTLDEDAAARRAQKRAAAREKRDIRRWHAAHRAPEPHYVMSVPPVPSPVTYAIPYSKRHMAVTPGVVEEALRMAPALDMLMEEEWSISDVSDLSEDEAGARGMEEVPSGDDLYDLSADEGTDGGDAGALCSSNKTQGALPPSPALGPARNTIMDHEAVVAGVKTVGGYTVHTLDVRSLY